MKKIFGSIAILFFTQTLFINAQTGSALDFDGVNDGITISSNQSMNLSKFTIETWLKWGRSGTAVDFVCAKGLEQLEIHTGGGSSNNIRFIPTTSVYLDAGIDAIATGTWVHLACVYDPSIGLAKMYINGVEVAFTQSGSNPLTTQIAANGNDLVLGKRNDGSFPFLGQLDEFRLWNVVRTQAEIQSKMNCEIPSDAYGLVVNNHFNQGIAAGTNTNLNTLIENTSNSNTGVLSNFALSGSASNWVTPGGVGNGNFCAINGNNAGCESVTLTVSGGISYLWSGGNATTSSVNTFTTSGLYTVTITAANASTSQASEYITISTTPSAPSATSPQTFCGMITTTDLLTSGENLKWYASSVGGTSISNIATFLGTNTFYVSQSPVGCESERTKLIATANSIPTVPTVSSVQSFCGAATVANLTADGQNLQWFYSPNPNALYPSTEELYTDTYYVRQTENGCSSGFGSVAVIASVTPSIELEASPSVTINSGEQITFEPYIDNGGPSPSFQWFINNSLVGTNSSIFSSSILNNKDQVKCIMTANNTCQTTITSSDFMTIRVREYAANNYEHVTNFGTESGNEIYQLSAPVDINIASDGRIYIADYYNNRIAIWTQTGNDFTPLATFGGTGQLNNPYDIELAGNGYIYVVEYTNHRISVWTQTGNNFDMLTTFGGFGNELNQFSNPTSLKIAPNGNIVICDYNNNRMSVWTQSGNNFGILTTFGGNTLDKPFAVEINTNNTIYIAEKNSNRISVWTQSGNNFDKVTTFGGYGSSLNQLQNPIGLHLDDDGKIYISESYNNRVSVWTQSGTNFGNFAVFGSSGDGNNSIGRPVGLSTDANNKVYIADDSYNKISIWQPCNVPSRIVTQPMSQSVCSGSSAIFTVSALGLNNNYEWNNENNTSSITVSGKNKNTRSYKVIVSGCGTYHSNYASLSTIASPSIATQPISQTVCGGNLASFSVSASGTNLSYLWNNNTTTTSINTSISGSYIVTVSGTCGFEISNPTTLTTNTITKIVTQPISQTVCGGNLASFSVSASGTNLSYLWNNNTTTTSINTSISGSYIVTVSGTCSSIVSNTTMLTVNNCTPLVSITSVTITSLTVSKNLSSTTSAILVSILGTGFVNGATVTIGGVVLSNVSVSGNVLTGFIPVGSIIINPNQPTITIQNPNQAASAEVSIAPTIISGINSIVSIQNNLFHIYPNPTTEIWYANNAEIGATLYVYNALGLVVFTEKIVSENTKIETFLPSGIYLVKVGLATTKLIIE